MSFSFKKFVELVDQAEEVSDEQINELFGLGKKEDPAEIARKKGEEFRARREALKKKQMQTPAGDDEEEDPKKKGAQPAQAARRAQPARPRDARADIRTANSAASTGQVDWAMEAADDAKTIALKKIYAALKEKKIKTSPGAVKSVFAGGKHALTPGGIDLVAELEAHHGFDAASSSYKSFLKKLGLTSTEIDQLS